MGPLLDTRRFVDGEVLPRHARGMRTLGRVPNDPSRFARLRPPLWAQWVLSLGVGAALLLGLVLFVEHHNTYSPAPENPAAAARANREAEIIVAQDQAPHVVRLESRISARSAFERTIRANMARRIAAGQFLGPLQRVACAAAGAVGAIRGFRCTVTAAGVNYAFLGTVDVGARRLSYCKRDGALGPAPIVPVSRRCLV